MNQYNLIIDTREKVGTWELTGSFIKGILRQKLSTGDYSLEGFENLLCIERKRNVGEIAGNITEKRFKDCLQRMSSYPHRHIVLEFSVDDVFKFPINSGIPKVKWRYLKTTPDFIMKCLMQMSLKYGINLWFAGNKANAERLVSSLIRRFLEQEAPSGKK